MRAEKFDKFDNDKKWEAIWNKEIKDVLWCCDDCGEIIDNEKTPTSMATGIKRCGNCDSLLTKRTGGGQNMPCNYTFIPNRKIKIEKIIKKLKWK